MNGSQQKQRRQGWFVAFGKRRARRTPGRRLAFEPMEGRVLMTADLGGNSFAAATELGTLSGTRQIADFVGNSDVNDFYRVRLTQPGTLRLALDGLAADADLELFNSSGGRLASSARGGTSSELIQQTLPAGTYVIRVFRFSGNTNYLLTMTATPNTPTVPDYAGNTLAAARNLGVVSGTRSYTDFVGRADPEAIDRVLGTGTYFVFVNPFGGANTNYRLSLSAAAQQQSPTITSLGGVTSTAAGVQNGLVNMSIGTAWNGYRAVNDQPGLYTWTIHGTNFGTQRGQVRLAGQLVPVISWFTAENCWPRSRVCSAGDGGLGATGRLVWPLG
jgi:hypothetical protein